MFSFSSFFVATKTTRVIFSPSCILSTDDVDLLRAYTVFRKHEVQNRVRRLHHQATIQVFLQGPILSCRQCPTPNLAYVSKSNVVTSRSRPLACSFSRKEDQNSFDSHFYCSIVVLKDHTVIQQVIVEAGWCRIPQHPSLHDARDINVKFNASRNVGFPALPRKFHERGHCRQC